MITAKRVHLVGIKGVAMTALAQCLLDLGCTITGSDLPENFVTQKILDDLRFTIYDGFVSEQVTKDIDLVIYTGAHQGKQNVEVQQAIKLGIPVLSQAEALGELTAEKRLISVCGTGGKSTTTAMIAVILERAGLHPSYAVGVGNISDLGRTGRYVSDGEWFVAEADEYAVDPTVDHRPRFIFQHPEVIVCTNLQYDHPDIYPDFEVMKQTFLDFFNSLPTNGTLIINGVDSDLIGVAKKLRSDIHVISCDLPEPLHLLIPGEFNQRNSAYAIAAAKIAGVDEPSARKSLENFHSTMRRFENKGVEGTVECFDDYAHTPDEIRATLTALRAWRPGKKIVAAFQPHTYSRTKALFTGFVSALQVADEVVLLDIFASAREKPDASVSSQMLVDAIGSKAKLISTVDELAHYLQSIIQSQNTVFITMGAGDIYKVYEKLPVIPA
ncbi:MAG TPA: cyanophycin synthetase [Patescibacteria group bacterium]|nr:cyanophycin synthetase [Patescibacteria group bacterium]